MDIMNYTTIFYKRENFKELKESKPYLFQTYHDKSKIPNSIYENIKKYAPEYNHTILDNQDAIDFLKKNFDSSVVDTFHLLQKGPHKADLLRYCLLYIYGGVYLDIKTELIRPLTEIFLEKDKIYSVLSKSQDHIYQGILSTPPRNNLFSEMIQFIVQHPNPIDYHLYCKDFYDRIRSETGTVQPGWNGNYYLFSEKCSSNASECHDGLDQYGLCCFVWDKQDVVIKTRRSSYPF